MGLKNVTGKIEEPTIIFIPHREIKMIRFSKKMMAYHLEIQTSQGNISYKVNKVMVGSSWHKENLAEILKKIYKTM